MGKFIISKRTNDEFQFNLKASNGEIILTSQGYNSQAGCMIGIASVRANALRPNAFERKISSNSKAYFNLKAANHEVIGTSEMYQSNFAMERGIESVKNNAPDAVLEIT